MYRYSTLTKTTLINWSIIARSHAPCMDWQPNNIICSIYKTHSIHVYTSSFVLICLTVYVLWNTDVVNFNKDIHSNICYPKEGE